MTVNVPTYCWREDVKRATDSGDTAFNNTQIDRAIAAATDTVDGYMHRRFTPLDATKSWPWPNDQYAFPWILWFDRNDLAAATQVVSGGVTITAGQYYLEPEMYGPPYNRIEIRLDTQAAFSVGATWQRSISITGTWCGCPLDTDPAGTLAAAITDTVGTTVTVTDASLVGVGAVLIVDSERMIVSDRAVTTTGQTVASLASSAAATTLTPSGSLAAFHVGEILTVDSERMLVQVNNGTSLTVKRAYDGTALAAHTGATIYADRLLTVVRGALGTTAATHSNGATLTTHRVPGAIKTLAIAEALVTELGETMAYSHTMIRGEGEGGSGRKPISLTALDKLREDAYARWGRKNRVRVV